MRTQTRALGWAASLAVLSAGCAGSAPTGPLTAETADGVAIVGELYSGGLGASAPLVLLFHQGGSNGRGEYGPLAPWLNDAGFRAVAWDLRAGGETHGETNRTVAGLAPGTAAAFCDAYSDLEAALDYVVTHGLADRVVLWGSSYSAALAVRLAAERPDRVAGVIAFSPASGGPMATCRAREWLGALAAPAVVYRPASEMERASAVEQRDAFVAAGVEVRVVEHGVHGASMLVDERTGHDMSAARAGVLDWLRAVTGAD